MIWHLLSERSVLDIVLAIRQATPVFLLEFAGF